jgi:CyaY protein
MTNGALAEHEFERAADSVLRALEGALSEVDGLEVDLESGILTLSFHDGTQYVVNSHRAARQIWMAAERTAWHFDFAGADRGWLATRTGEELRAAVAGVVSRKLGRAVSLGAA